MKILFLFLKYAYIFGLVSVSMIMLNAALKIDKKRIESKFKFFSTAAIFFILFLLILIQQSKWQVFCSDSKIIESIDRFDRREWLKDERIVGGKIFDRTRKTENNLAFDLRVNNRKNRVYPFGKAASHIIGYNDIERGSSGIEMCYYEFLLGKDNNFFVNFLKFNQKGKNLYLTIDSRLQQEAYSAFEERCGSAVVLIPKTGEVLCMVSSPGFQPNEVSDDSLWVDMINDVKGAPMFNRALKGRYPPGSIFKIVTSAAAIENNYNKKFYSLPKGYQPSGARRRIFDIEKRIYERMGKKWKGHGLIDLKTAMEKSSNVYFSKLGVELSKKILQEYAEKFGFNREIEWNTANNLFKKEFSIKKGFFPDDLSSGSDIAWASIGQQRVLVTPMQAALFTAAVANDGVLMYPRIELNRKNKKGWRVIKKSTAKTLQDILRNVVNRGTGYRTNIPGLDIAGKTGTAEITENKNICWFTAFAPYRNSRVALAVVVENGEYGGRDAALIARKILLKAKNLGYFN